MFKSKVLVVTVNQGKETLASAYFHWSASPESSIELTKTILDFENGFDIKNQKLKAVQILESTSAGFESDTMDVLKKEFQEIKNIKFNKVISRTEGIIEIEQDKINEHLSKAKDVISIDLDSRTIKLDTLKNLGSELDLNIEKLSFEDFLNKYEEIKNYIDILENSQISIER